MLGGHLVKQNCYFHYIFFNNIPVLFLFLTLAISIFLFSEIHFLLQPLKYCPDYSLEAIRCKKLILGRDIGWGAGPCHSDDL